MPVCKRRDQRRRVNALSSSFRQIDILNEFKDLMKPIVFFILFSRLGMLHGIRCFSQVILSSRSERVLGVRAPSA